MKSGKLAVLLLLSLVLVPSVLAQSLDLIEPLRLVFGPFIDLFGEAGQLGANAALLVAITRFVIWLVVFAVVFA